MTALASRGNGIQTKLLWAAVASLGAVSFGIVALTHGESVNAAWLVIAAVCVYFISYRFYALFVANKALGVDANRQTPAWRHNDGLDYVPTNRYVLYGHHFAAIAGAGALVVVKALVGSPWGTFAVFLTIPIAILMGIYSQYIRPGRIGEMSILGAVLLVAALIYGRTIAETPALAAYFDLSGETLALTVIGYGFVASVLPVWLLLAPRDYLSTFLKIGTITLLAIGIIIVRPDLQMPAFTKFIDGTGPVWAGGLFPFLFITIACGSVSGWHALIASGTTPKMIENENQIAFIGYGAMLTESFVAIMALIGASVIHPGVYFAMNSSAGLIGTTADRAAQVISSWGFTVTPDVITQMARDVGETTIMSRTGGAPTLAVGMASILSGFLGGRALMGIWYHFAILFEALFILTTVDAGTRVLRFMIQDLVGNAIPAFRETKSWTNNLIGSALAVTLWGYFLYVGVIDPLGGIFTLWPLFGTANQMLAAIALMLCTVLLFKMKHERFAWVTVVPMLWLVATTVTAGFEKVFNTDPDVGFVSHALQFSRAAAAGQVLAPAKTLEEMSRIVFNDYVDATLSALFVAVVVASAVYGVINIRKALGSAKATAIELGEARMAGAVAGGGNV
jgi:carbon starvation protein CstA